MDPNQTPPKLHETRTDPVAIPKPPALPGNPSSSAPPVPPVPPAIGKKGKLRPIGGCLMTALILGILGAIALPVGLYLFLGKVSDSINLGSGAGGRTGAQLLQERVLRRSDGKDKIALVDVVGVISGGPVDPSGRTQVDLIQDQLQRIQEDSDIRAVVLRVDSPGGEVLASDEIYRALWKFQADSKKPVIASMGSVAASGGYYVSAPCQWIVANELTMTGSIGVIFQGINYRELMDKVGVRPKTIKSGKLKDMWSAMKSEEDELPEEREILEEMITETFGRFKQVIVEGRQRAAELNGGDGKALSADWESFADGRVLSGKVAFENGFVDELGNLDTALDRAMELVEVDTASVVTFSSPFSFFNMFRLFGEAQSGGVKVDVDLGLPSAKALPFGRMYFVSPWHLP